MSDNQMKVKKRKTKDKAEHLTCPAYLYYLLYLPVCFLFKLVFRVHTKVDKAYKNEQKAELILCNHSSPFDFLYIGLGLHPKKVAFVVAKQMLYRKLQGFIIRRTYSITKQQFVPDVGCIKSIKKHIENGVSVVLYPEGKISAAGYNNYLAPSLGKLIKMLKVPVAVCKVDGAYLSSPLWARTYRRGKINVSIENILSAEDVSIMDQKEIFNRVNQSMQYNDWQYQIDHNIRYYGKGYARGLDRIIYKCPNCGEEYNMASDRKNIYCTHCGYSARLGHDGWLYTGKEKAKIDRIDKWYDYQKASIATELEDENFALSAEVDIYYAIPNSSKFLYGEAGSVSYDKDGLTYTGEKGNKVFFSASNIPTMTFKPGEYFSLYEGSNIYRIVVKNKQMVTKFNLVAEAIHAKYYDK